MSEGIDISCTNDLDPSLRVVSGDRALAESLFRRLITPEGGGWWDEEYGGGLLDFLGSMVSDKPAALASRVEARVERELLKEERVSEVSVSVSVEESADRDRMKAQRDLRITVGVTKADGTNVTLTIAVDDGTAALLSGS